jgi:DNA-binding CsgD family transcriptional regulator
MTTSTTNSHLRPLERRVLAMRREGVPDTEIGRRVRKSPERVSLIAQWTELPGRGRSGHPRQDLLSPLQRRVVEMRAEGQSHSEIGEKFRRSERYIRQVEGLARFRQFRDLLG